MDGQHGLTLIVGAGPTGLTAACELLSAGVPVRIVDAAPGPTSASKALLLWPRTLDVLANLRVRTDPAETLMLDSFRYYSGIKPIANVTFGSDLAPMCVLQSATEKYLRARLAELGGHIKWGTSATAVSQTPTTATATLSSSHGQERVDANWVIAADGAHSAIRKSLAVPFTGTTYESQFALIDAPVRGHLPPNAALYFQSPRGALVIVALPGGNHRVFGSVPRSDTPCPPSRTQMQRLLDDRGPGGLHIGDPLWAATFNVHARAARDYRDRRVFLAGDAAHIHSPAGGQGLNAGIQDAHNLAWKIAAVNDGADPALLDSYQQERQAITRRIVRDADLQTRGWLLTNPWKIAARDTAARIADRTNVLNNRYAPLLAGRSHRYTTSTALHPSKSPLVGTAVPASTLEAHNLPTRGWRIVCRDDVGAARATTSNADRQIRPGLLDSLDSTADFVVIRPDNTIAAAGASRHLPGALHWFANLRTERAPRSTQWDTAS